MFNFLGVLTTAAADDKEARPSDVLAAGTQEGISISFRPARGYQKRKRRGAMQSISYYVSVPWKVATVKWVSAPLSFSFAFRFSFTVCGGSRKVVCNVCCGYEVHRFEVNKFGVMLFIDFSSMHLRQRVLRSLPLFLFESISTSSAASISSVRKYLHNLLYDRQSDLQLAEGLTR